VLTSTKKYRSSYKFVCSQGHVDTCVSRSKDCGLSPKARNDPRIATFTEAPVRVGVVPQPNSGGRDSAN